jgi:hypothetical protein
VVTKDAIATLTTAARDVEQRIALGGHLANARTDRDNEVAGLQHTWGSATALISWR